MAHFSRGIFQDRAGLGWTVGNGARYTQRYTERRATNGDRIEAIDGTIAELQSCRVEETSRAYLSRDTDRGTCGHSEFPPPVKRKPGPRSSRTWQLQFPAHFVSFWWPDYDCIIALFSAWWPVSRHLILALSLIVYPVSEPEASTPSLTLGDCLIAKKRATMPETPSYSPWARSPNIPAQEPKSKKLSSLLFFSFLFPTAHATLAKYCSKPMPLCLPTGDLACKRLVKPPCRTTLTINPAARARVTSFLLLLSHYRCPAFRRARNHSSCRV